MENLYNDQLSEFMLDIAGEFGGGLPSDYFTSEELDELESYFQKIFYTNLQISHFIDKKLERV
jgi:hypothetical protein